MLTAERFRIAQVALVELDVFFREIARVKDAIVPACVQKNVQIEFRPGDNRAQGLQTNPGRLAAPNRERDLRFSREAVTNIDFHFANSRL
jgi:hypothetical protein